MNFHLSVDDTARPACGLVRFDGARTRTDDPSLIALTAGLATAVRVHVDLGHIECVPFSLVTWLLREQRSVGRRGGRLTVGRAPAVLARILSTIGLEGALELTDARA